MSVWMISIEKTPDATYVMHGAEFVARFKHANPTRSAKHFAKFLIANYSPEEYFNEMKTGRAPLCILSDKGFISYNSSLSA